MTRITQAILVDAARAVNRMGAQERLQLADEVFAHQPNLLASVVVLRQMGASDDTSGSARGHAKLLVARPAPRACSTQPFLPATVIERPVHSELDAQRHRHAQPREDSVVKTRAAGLDKQPLVA